MYYMVLRDTALYLYTDENCYKRSTLCTNTVHLQHALATKAADYTKKKHVFRLQTADLAQYLIQTRSLHGFCDASAMSHVATLSRNSDAQPCRRSDTDKLHAAR